MSDLFHLPRKPVRPPMIVTPASLSAVRALRPSTLRPSTLLLSLALLFCCGAAAELRAQTVHAQPATRIVRTAIDNGNRSLIAGSRPAHIAGASDAGRMAADTRIEGGTLILSRSAAQQSALDALVAAQADPSSPHFRQWLTPQQFGAEFGASDADLATLQQWLEGQGLAVTDIAPNRSQIRFSGSVRQIESAFATEMHRITVDGEQHFAPSTDLSVPAAFAGSILAIGNLHDFKPRSQLKLKTEFTSSISGSHYTTPGDLAVIYDINAAYSAGFTGTGQTIAVMGQSAIVTTDITNFQNASGLPVHAPSLVLVPNTGTSVLRTQDEAESDLDVEYSGAVAKGANVVFVYTGSNTNYGVLDALIYAINSRVAPIITISYGACEVYLGQSYYNQYNTALQQAAAQGQTVIASSGDTGSSGCFGFTALSAATQESLAVSFPASSQYVTALGGSEFLPSATAIGNSQYYIPSTGTDILVSAKGYIPEQAWNDDSSNGLSSGGGGISLFSPRPAWQTGVPGIPSGTARLLPDISLTSSPNSGGLLYCSSDVQDVRITGSCANGFRDINNYSVTVAGGTSFAAPIFAGMLAIINQRLGGSAATMGQGLIGPTLYSLALRPAIYASAFHDITVGSNACLSGPSICSTAGAGSYSTGVGYDLATGIGSVDFYNLMQAWANAASSPAAVVTLTPATAMALTGTNDAISIKVASGNSNSTATPTGSVTISVDGGTATVLQLSAGQATYNFNSGVAGAHQVNITYSGDAIFPLSAASLNIIVTSPGTFTLQGANVTATGGNTAGETITVTPAGGFTGAVSLTLTTTVNVANLCYTLANPTVTSGPATAAVTLYTNGNNCPSGAIALKSSGGTKAAALAHPLSGTPSAGSLPAELTLAGLVALGLLGRRSRRLRGLVLMAMLAAGGLAIAGCGGVSTAGAGISPNAPAGSYVITVTGSDAATGTKTASTTFTLVVQ